MNYHMSPKNVFIRISELIFQNLGVWKSAFLCKVMSWKETSYYVLHFPVLCRYIYRIPENYPPASAAPLLCAGITVYTPMMRHNMNKPGKWLGVIGLNGLGHLAVKFGKAFGMVVAVLSTKKRSFESFSMNEHWSSG